jgi:polyvinyl alcohol dehydrogenase (cytochrome)
MPRSIWLLSLLSAALLSLALAPALGAGSAPAPTGAHQSLNWGGNLHNTHFAEAETVLSPANVSRLAVKWSFETTGDVSAIPTLADGLLYFPDWGPTLTSYATITGGSLFALDAARGVPVWSRPFNSYGTNPLNNTTRTSPAIAGDLIIVGNVLNQPLSLLGVTLGSGATVYAINRFTGDLVWQTTIDPHPLAQVTQSPVVYGGRIYVGVSSLEEGAARLAYPCCTFRGSMVALDLASGRIDWQTYMEPANGGKPGGYSGAAVWGSSPSIDVSRGVVYIATGNAYTYPKALVDCLAARRGNARGQDECLTSLDAPDDYAESILALDLTSGAVRWARQLHNYGAWTSACSPNIAPLVPVNPANCVDLDGLDYDFGQAPMLFSANVNGVLRDLVGAGQKTGVFWALDPDAAGQTVWSTLAGPAGVEGGMEFGSAMDGKRIYVEFTNFDHNPFLLTAGSQAGQTAHGGMWAALDPATGALLWQTPDPSSTRPLVGFYANPAWGFGKGPGFFAAAMGPLTVANGVLFGGSMDPEGHMYAFDASSGAILWSFASGGSVMSAPAVVDGVVYWGSGYRTGFDAHKMYAFALPN